MIASARERVLNEASSSFSSDRSDPARAGGGVSLAGHASPSSDRTVADTAWCAARVSSRYSASPVPGLGWAVVPEGDVQPVMNAPTTLSAAPEHAMRFKRFRWRFIADPP